MKAQRRAFLGSLAAAPLLPAALVESPTSSATPEANALADALLAAARARFGHSFGPGDAEEIKKGIESSLKSAERLRAHRLTNADEPATIFEARARTARPGGRR
jgi:hypothetical protein